MNSENDISQVASGEISNEQCPLVLRMLQFIDWYKILIEFSLQSITIYLNVDWQLILAVQIIYTISS